MYIFILKRVGEVIQECELCTSGIFKKKHRKMQKHGYLNMIYNKNPKDL
jgi:hypothetical protein